MKSDALTVSTKEQENSYEQWDAYKAYKKGDKVVPSGKVTRQFKVIKEMGNETGFLLYHYGKK